MPQLEKDHTRQRRSGKAKNKNKVIIIFFLKSYIFKGDSRRRNGKPLQYSCLDNPTDQGAWKATVQSWKESDTTERLGAREFNPPMSEAPFAGSAGLVKASVEVCSLHEL